MYNIKYSFYISKIRGKKKKKESLWFKARKHRRGWEGAVLESDVGCGNWHCCLRVGAVSELVFFFFFGIHAYVASIRTDSGWFAPNWGDSTRIGSYRPNRDRIGRQSKLTEMTEKCQNRFWMRPKHPKFVLPQFYSEYLWHLLCFILCLLLSLFCEPRP